LNLDFVSWVSSLAYPNLLGTKGYVVVVVVIFMEINHNSKIAKPIDDA